MYRDYLKYYRIVLAYHRVKNNLSQPEIDMVLFLYSEGIFSSSDFARYNQVFAWDKQRLNKMIDKGFVEYYRKGGGPVKHLYKLTFKGQRMVDNIYKHLEGEALIPTNKQKNPMFLAGAPYSYKVMANAIKQMRKALTDLKKGKVKTQ